MIERPHRHQSKEEERINCLSHGLGAVCVVWVMPHLISAAANHGDAISVVGASVFCVTLILLYVASTVYHGVPMHHLRTKRIFNLIDHVSVYFLIAGTYTPFTLDTLRGPFGWTLFGLIWSLAITGAILKFKGRLWNQPYSVASYLAMGWLVLIAVRPLTAQVRTQVILCLFAGGILYSIGVYFYLAKHRRYTHCVWHLFVLGGSAAHIGAVFGIYLEQ